MREPLLTRYLLPLLAGRRAECFAIIQQALIEGATAESLLREVVWPAMTQIERLHREDHINAAAENMATRINRTVADQLQVHLPRRPTIGKRALIACGNSASEETGAQIVADLLQSEGWETFLVGAGVPHDEILKLVGELRPHVLVIQGAQPGEVPNVRSLIGAIREIGVCATMNVIVCGGVFTRADGLWQEVGADAHAENGTALIQIVATLRPREQGLLRPLGIVKKRNRKRKSAVAGLAAVPARIEREPALV